MGEPVNGILAVWNPNHAGMINPNHAIFEKQINAGKSPIEAALATRSGQIALAYGFPEVYFAMPFRLDLRVGDRGEIRLQFRPKGAQKLPF